MANNKESRRTFKYGDREYYVDDLLKLHADQFSHYLNFAKERGLYNDSALVGLRESILSRINAVKSGQNFEGDGVLGSDRVDNITIETKGRGRKNLTINQDNTEWSKHYLNKLIGALTPVSDQNKANSSWDINKYGIGAYLTAQGLNAQEIFENYDVGDGTNTNRTAAQRRELLKTHLPGYYNWLLEKGFDFNSDDNDWNNNFLEEFNQFITDYDTLDDNAIATRLRKFGAGDAYATAFTSHKWDLTKTPEQLEADAKAAADKKKAEEDAAREAEKKEAWNNYVKQQYDIYSRLSDNNYGGTFFTTSGDDKFEMTDAEFGTWAENTKTNNMEAYLDNLQKQYQANPFDRKLAAEYLPLADYAGLLESTVIDGVTYKYDPELVDETKNRAVVFNPETREIKHVFLWDLEGELDSIKNKWLIDNGYEQAYSKYQSHKNGGIMTMQTGGDFRLADAVKKILKERNAAKAAASGKTEEQQAAMDRVVSTGEAPFTSADDTIAQQEAGFTTADKVRLASIGVDIGSIFLPPTAGTIAGIGSSFMNFGSDIADDGLDWGDVKNLGINIGLDLVSWIPVVGDAVGTGTKVIRKLVKYAPKMMAYIGTLQGLANSGAILDSVQKLLSGDADKKMTVQDWRNIYQGIHLITSGTTALKNKHATKNTLKKAKLEDSVGVTVKSADGKTKQLLVNGETANKIREAGGDKATIEKALSETAAFKDQVGAGKPYEVVTSVSKGLQLPFGKDPSTGSWGLRSPLQEGRAKVVDIYDFGKLKTGENPLTTHQQATEWGVTPFSKKDQIDLRGTEADLNAQIARVRKANERRVVVDPETGKVTRKTGADKSDAIAQTKKEIAELEAKLNGVKRDQVQQDLSSAEGRVSGVAKLESRIKDANKQAEILASQIETSKQKIVESLNKNVYPYPEVAKYDALQRQLTENKKRRAELSESLDDLKKHKEQEAAHRLGLRATLQDFDALGRARARLNRLSQKQKADTKASKAPTRAYTKLEQMINDINANLNVKLDMKKILEGAGIPEAFKDGGPISRHKMNKFLNYAKR
jgi:hypothetical protein